MKNPNGYGTVYKLPGNRRNPWAVVLTVGYDSGGKQKRKYLGFYKDQKDAKKALADYNDKPFDLNGFTFAEVFDKYSEYKFPSISSSNISGYNAAFAKCKPIHDKLFHKIEYADLQAIVDPCTPPTQKKIKTLFSQIYAYAVKRGITSSDLSPLIETKPIIKSTLHDRFTPDEISILWEASADEYIQVILMMIYSGVRPGELLALRSADVDMVEHSFSVVAGKNNNAVRKVPIHDRTLPFFAAWLDRGTEYLITDSRGTPFNFQNDHNKYTAGYFNGKLANLGILHFGGGKFHHPDDARHTFTTMWTEKRLNEIYRRAIQGHSGKGVGEAVYTHISFEELLSEINKL